MRARSANDISVAVKFAGEFNIPLVIKNSGHDYLGRASRRNALMIWTHFMDDVEFLSEDGKWEPAGCTANDCRAAAGKHKESGLLVKAHAGVNLYQLYSAVTKKGRIVVAGAATTVGVSGGYIQAGGHSPLGPFLGMGSDNMVEAEVVIADVCVPLSSTAI